ncbi:hypothetical protein A0H81_10363 [Grifola frondosa]|uniref:Uncharacterized protein n=1 Tax=Grifola frondosa TaxID=5627 RepID=A0A1C7M0H0_GRIFR|nr:hypothetical protein A0H81_10363 [Grifola frondosa]
MRRRRNPATSKRTWRGMYLKPDTPTTVRGMYLGKSDDEHARDNGRRRGRDDEHERKDDEQEWGDS